MTTRAIYTTDKKTGILVGWLEDFPHLVVESRNYDVLKSKLKLACKIYHGITIEEIILIEK